MFKRNFAFSELSGKGPTVTDPKQILSIGLIPIDLKKTRAGFCCAPISGIDTKGLLCWLFLPSRYFHCSWQKRLDPSHNGKLQLFM